MANFPTLSSGNPSISGWEEQFPFDPTLKSPFEAGYVQTRPKFTRIPNGWHLFYPVLPDADKNDLHNFEIARKVGSESFNWTNPKTSVVHIVRFKAPIKYKMLSSDLWSADFDLEEV